MRTGANVMAKIVIVEDDQNICQELTQVLSNAGYDAFYVDSFCKTKEIASNILHENPDLLLLDMNLPNANGLLICDEIRRKSKLPIIFVTSNNTSMDELNCMMRGADDYIAKPYQLPILMARIAAILRRTSNDTKKSV